jgi:hypothetical protein
MRDIPWVAVPAGVSGAEVSSTGHARIRRARSSTGTRPAKAQPAWQALDGVAAIPATALDPPHSAAPPAVPALFGSGSP